MKILLATDGSEYCEAAVDEIAHGHFPEDSEVRVLSVIDPPYFPDLGGVDMNLYNELQKAANDRAEAAVEKAAAKLREPGRKLKVTTATIPGSPKKVILEEADAFDADLIVVASHGHSALDRFLLGSVSQAIAVHAKCSVEIVRDSKHRHQP